MHELFIRRFELNFPQRFESANSSEKMTSGDVVDLTSISSSQDHHFPPFAVSSLNQISSLVDSSNDLQTQSNNTRVLLFLSNAGSIIARSEIASLAERIKNLLKRFSRTTNQIRFHLQFNISLTLGQLLKYGIPITAVVIICIYKLISYVKYRYLRDKSKDISNPNNKYRISLKKLWKRKKTTSQEFLSEHDVTMSSSVYSEDDKSVQTNASELMLPSIPSSYSLSDRDINGVKGVMLPSGRWLSYEEYGATSSKTRVIIFFHSLGHSRLELPNNDHDSIAKRLNVRFIHVDRPGYGQSTQQKSRTFLSFAKDIAHLSNILEIEQYAVMGISSGAPYAWACSYLNIENKVIACSILSGDLPYHFIPHRQMSRFLKDVSLFVHYVPSPIFKLILNLALSGTLFREPEKFTAYIRQSAYFSKENIEDLQIFCSHCILSMREGLNANGVAEIIRELKMERSDWGFSLKDISIPLHIWHGESSQIVPLHLVKSTIASLVSDKYNESKLYETKLVSQKLSHKRSATASSNSGMTRVGSSETIETMTTSVTVDTRKTEESNLYRYTNVQLHTVHERGHFFWKNTHIFEEVVRTLTEHMSHTDDTYSETSFGDYKSDY